MLIKIRGAGHGIWRNGVWKGNVRRKTKYIHYSRKESNDPWQWSSAVGHLCVGVESAGEDTNTIYSLKETLLLQAPSFISNVMHNSLDSTNNIIRNKKSPDILGVYDLCNYTTYEH